MIITSDFVVAKKTIVNKQISLYEGNVYEVTNQIPYNDGIIKLSREEMPKDARVGSILDETGRYKRVWIHEGVFEDASNDEFYDIFGIETA